MKRKSWIPAIAVLAAITVMPAVPAAAAQWETGIAPASTAVQAQASFSAKEYQSAVLRLVNQQRTVRSLKPLTVTAAMDGIAAVRAKEASVRFSHTRPDGSNPSSLFAQRKIAFSSAGENLAYGYRSPEALVSAWMSSPEHRSNLLSARFTNTGIGAYQSADGKIYCAQLFSRP